MAGIVRSRPKHPPVNVHPMTEPAVDDRDPAKLVPAAIEEILDLARTWLAWDGTPILSDGNVWTPHKALRRVADHLIDHLGEIECRLAGVSTLTHRWHGRMLTLDSDWARFTEADVDEATSRLGRLAAYYANRIAGLDDATLDAAGDGWTLRQVVHHVSNVRYYAAQVGRLGESVSSSRP
jgi:hypothetical protein